MTSTWFTTLAAIREAEPEWQAIACYREPIARFLRRVYPRLASDLRDDIVQEVLCAMRTSAVARFQPDRGRFRDYLRGIIQNQVRAAVRAQLRAPSPIDLDPGAIEAASEDEVDAVDLAACLVRAVRDFHDRALKDDDRGVLYCLSDRLVDGLTYPQIADKEGISRDAVKRRLQAARKGVLQALLAAALDEHRLDPLPPRKLAKAADRVGEALASRRPAEEALGRLKPPEVRAVAARLVDHVRAGVRRFPGLDSPDGRSFVNALRAVLEEDAGLP